MKNISIQEVAEKIPLMKGKSFWSNREPRGAVKEFFIQLVNEGRFTVEEIQNEMRKRYPEIREGTVNGYPRHATNEHGLDQDKMRFPYKAVIDDYGIIKFDKNFPAGSW